MTGDQISDRDLVGVYRHLIYDQQSDRDQGCVAIRKKVSNLIAIKLVWTTRHDMQMKGECYRKRISSVGHASTISIPSSDSDSWHAMSKVWGIGLGL